MMATSIIPCSSLWGWCLQAICTCFWLVHMLCVCSTLLVSNSKRNHVHQENSLPIRQQFNKTSGTPNKFNTSDSYLTRLTCRPLLAATGNVYSLIPRPHPRAEQQWQKKQFFDPYLFSQKTRWATLHTLFYLLIMVLLSPLFYIKKVELKVIICLSHHNTFNK